MKLFTLVMAMFAVAGLVLGGCYNSTRVRIPLQGSPASLDCHSACTSSTAEGSKARLSCLTACPGARKSSGTCQEADLPPPPAGLCEQQREFSTWKSLGIAVVALVVVVLASGGGGE